MPTNPVAVAVALADKLDTLVGFWAIDEKPTGSKDPYALRRAALGVVRIILESGVTIILQETLEGHFLLKQPRFRDGYGFENTTETFLEFCTMNTGGGYGAGVDNIRVVREHAGEITNNLLDFILDRLKVHLREQGVKHDHIDAVFSLGGDDLIDITNRVTALGAFLSTDDGANLLAGYKRAVNILKAEAKKGALPDAEPGRGTQVEEGALYDALAVAGPAIETALAAEDYAGAMTALAGLRGPIDVFFDEVTVNSDVAAERDNRLGLLMQVRKLAGTIADFDKVEG